MILEDISQKDKQVIDEGRRKFIALFTNEEEKTMAIFQMYPEVFIEKVLGVNGENGYKLTKQQKEILEVIGRLSFCKRARYDAERSGNINLLPRPIRKYADKIAISVRAGRGVGKSAVLSLLIFWLLCCFENAKLPLIAPSERTLKTVLMSELNTWYNRKNQQGEYLFKEPFRSKINIQASMINYEGKANWNAFTKVAPNVADEATLRACIGGLHANTFVPIIDEANGCRDAVFFPISDSMTGPNNFAILMWNATKTSGYTYDTHFNPTVSPYYVNLHWSAEDCEIITKDYLDNLARRYGGRQNNEYKVSVLGEPPDSEDSSLIPYKNVNEAIYRLPNPVNKDNITFGLDPARSGGDKSCLCIRKGLDVISFEYINGLDIFEVAKEVYLYAEKWKPTTIVVDKTGLGCGYHDALRQQFEGSNIKIYGIGFSESASNTKKYKIIRDEIWHKLRGIFMKESITIPQNENLRIALSTAKFKEEGGKIKVEPKLVMRKRLSRSPDEADALAISFWHDDQYERYNGKPRIKDYMDEEPFTPKHWMAI